MLDLLAHEFAAEIALGGGGGKPGGRRRQAGRWRRQAVTPWR